MADPDAQRNPRVPGLGLILLVAVSLGAGYAGTAAVTGDALAGVSAGQQIPTPAAGHAAVDTTLDGGSGGCGG